MVANREWPLVRFSFPIGPKLCLDMESNDTLAKTTHSTVVRPARQADAFENGKLVSLNLLHINFTIIELECFKCTTGVSFYCLIYWNPLLKVGHAQAYKHPCRGRSILINHRQLASVHPASFSEHILLKKSFRMDFKRRAMAKNGWWTFTRRFTSSSWKILPRGYGIDTDLTLSLVNIIMHSSPID